MLPPVIPGPRPCLGSSLRSSLSLPLGQPSTEPCPFPSTTLRSVPFSPAHCYCLIQATTLLQISLTPSLSQQASPPPGTQTQLSNPNLSNPLPYLKIFKGSALPEGQVQTAQPGPQGPSHLVCFLSRDQLKPRVINTRDRTTLPASASYWPCNSASVSSSVKWRPHGENEWLFSKSKTVECST